MKVKVVPLLAAAVVACIAPACNRNKYVEPPASFSSLPDATNVLAALDQKNYEEAMATLSKIKDAATSEEQQKQFIALNHAVSERLAQAAPTDPKAGEAFQAWRAINIGH